MDQVSRQESEFWVRWRAGVNTVAVLLSSAIAGATMIAVAWQFGRYGPLIVIGLGVAPLLIIATINDARYALLALFASFLFGFQSVTIYEFNIQSVDIAVLITTLLVILQRIATRQPPIHLSGSLFWALALFFWALLSMTSAVDQISAVKQLGSFASGITLATIVYTLSRKVDDLRFIASSLVLFACLIVLPALAQAGDFRSYYGGGVVEGRLTGLFTEPNELGLFCSMTALMTIGLMLGAKQLRSRLAYAAALGVLLSGLMLSLSRGAWLGLLLGGLTLLIVLPAARRLLLAAGLPLVAIGIFVSSLVPSAPTVEIVGERLQSLADIGSPYDERPEIYEEALRQVRDDPWTGQGPGNFGVAAQRLAPGGVVVTAPHAHNAYLNIAAELGIPALTFVLFFIISIGRRGRRAIRLTRHENRAWDAAIIAGLTAALVANAGTGLVNNFLGNPILESVQWATIGMVLGGYRAVTAGLPSDQVEGVGEEVPVAPRSHL